MPPYFLLDRIASIAFYATCFVWIVLELVAGLKRNEPSAQKRDRGSRIVLYVAIYLGMTLAFFAANALRNFAMPEPRTIIFWIGIALMLFGVAFRWYAIRALGKFFTYEVAVRAEQSVVEVGPYHYVRHPSYTGGLITFLGIGLALGNWASIVAIMLCAIAGYGYRVRVEEKALVDAIGQPYVEYMRRTRRFIPFVV